MKKLTQNEELLFCNLKLEDIASRAKMLHCSWSNLWDLKGILDKQLSIFLHMGRKLDQYQQILDIDSDSRCCPQDSYLIFEIFRLKLLNKILNLLACLWDSLAYWGTEQIKPKQK